MRHEVFFDPEAYRLMSEHIRSLYPHEACGVLVGDCRGERIGDVCITENTVADDRAGRSFFIDPLEIYRIEKETAGKESIIGFFHSHPDRPAVVSEKDEEFMIPGMLYLIVSVDDKGVREIRGYKKEQDIHEGCQDIRIHLKMRSA